MANSIWYEIGRALRGLLLGDGQAKKGAAQPSKNVAGTNRSSGQAHDEDVESPGQFGSGATRDMRGDEIESLRIEYSPAPDGDPDPGEVVWTWVPYVENDGRGKDRPVLIIGRVAGDAVAGCYLSTKQHRGFISVGTGGWDSQGRESFLSTERVLRITHDGMRREGHVMPRERFMQVTEVIAERLGIQG